MTTKFFLLTYFGVKMCDVTSDITSYVILHHTIYGQVDFGKWYIGSMVEEGCGR